MDLLAVNAAVFDQKTGIAVLQSDHGTWNRAAVGAAAFSCSLVIGGDTATHPTSFQADS